jgi:site-specific recombinase XerC
MNKITGRLNPGQAGMTDANRAKLAQFHDPEVLRKFLCHSPNELDRLHAQKTLTHSQAVRASKLLALEILIHAPMRCANLASLRLGENLILPPGDAETSVLLAAHMVKNAEPLNYILPANVTALIRLHLTRVVPMLTDSADGFLFPGTAGGAQRTDSLSKGLSNLVLRDLGLQFSPHLMRHLAAKIHLDERPGDYESMKRLLGHRAADTTHIFYSGMETESASKLNADLIARKRGALKSQPKPRTPRGRRAA